MPNISRLLAMVTLVSVVAGCSAQGHREIAQAGRQTDGISNLAGQWREPDTIMQLANGHMLYVFGQGEDTRIVTPVRAIPGHSLVMISENGKAPRIVQDRGKNPTEPATQAVQRIVWIETTRNGDILLAGCSGCTEEEDRMLAMQVRRECEGKALARSTDYADYTD